MRLDTHVVAGYRVPPNYDSLVAKLLVHQPTRAEAIAVMRRALGEFVVEGIKTTIPLHQEIFNTSAFVEGQVDTTFIERVFYGQGTPSRESDYAPRRFREPASPKKSTTAARVHREIHFPRRYDCGSNRNTTSRDPTGMMTPRNA